MKEAQTSPRSLEANRCLKYSEKTDEAPLPAWATAPTNREPGQWLSRLDRLIISNTLVCTGAAIAEPLMGMADTFFVGHLGLVSLASLGPNNTAFSFISFFGAFSLSVATTDRIAISRAKGQPQEGALSMSIALSLSIYIGLGLAIAMLVAPHQILTIIGANGEIMPQAVIFMRARAVSVPPMLICIAIEGAYRAFLDLKTPFAVIAGAAAINVVLNVLFLFGLQLGVRGSALATTISTYTSALCFVFLLRTRDQGQFEPTDGPANDAKQSRCYLQDAVMIWRVWRLPAWRREAGEICSRCGVLILRAALIVAVYSVAGSVAARMGTAEVAGHQVLRQLLSLQVCLTWAYMSVGQSLVANVFESGDRGRAIALKVARRVILLGTSTAIVLATLMWVSRNFVLRLFVEDAAALEVMQPALLPACVMLLASANNAFEGVLLGAGDTGFCSRSFIPASLTAVTLLCLALKRHGGLGAVWWALASYYCVLAALFAARVLLPAMKGPLRMQNQCGADSSAASDKAR